MSFGPALRAMLGIALLTAMDAVIKAQMHSHPFIVALFMRFAMGSVFALLFVVAARPPRPNRASLIGNTIRVPIVVMTAGSFFYSISVLPLAEALTLSFLAPVFVALLGGLLLKEKLDSRIFQALAFGVAGMLVMVWPRLQGNLPSAELGVAAALFSAVAYAFNLILLRRIAQKEHPATIVLFQNGGPALCLVIPAAFAFVPMTGADLAAYALAGALAVGGHFMLVSAFARAEASRLAPLEYTALIWASILGYLMFGEVPLYTTYAGAVLIVAGAIAINRK